MEPILKLQEISKSFYGVKVLKSVNFDLRKGEVHALLGENGAGKSTLIKILSGAYQLDSGRIVLKGKEIITKYGPKEAEDLGIVTVYQNFHLVPHLTVAENLAIRRFTTQRGLLVNWPHIYREAAKTLEKFGFKIDPKSRIRDLAVAKRQMVEIALALSKRGEILIMDEPTAALSKTEIAVLFEIIGQLKSQGIGIVYVSHKLEEIKQIGDRVTILRDGSNIATLNLREADLRDIIRLMIGREITIEQKERVDARRDTVLALEGVLNQHFVHPLNLVVREHEVLGLTGLIGAGKTELARAIFGVDKIGAGKIYLHGKAVKINSPRRAVTSGIGYLPEDRDGKGLCLNMGVRENLTLAFLAKLQRLFFDRVSETKLAKQTVKSVQIKASSIAQPVKYLSGGNKQKVVFGKWLEANCQVLILDEPTMGIDIGARKEIYDLVRRFIDRPRTGVVFISSDVDEILEIADRIVVMSDRRIVAELNAQEANKQEIVEYS
ncbi:MAG TPA: sugar ABC transporter ATP-binding protein, partial [Chthoniobacterales bacterium]|nr:sugar ABC transporter ATP-binding protein [Chthoniobacterales bacterium]